MNRRKLLKILLIIAGVSIALSGALYLVAFQPRDLFTDFEQYGTFVAPFVYMLWEFVATVIPPVPNPISAIFAGYFFGVIPGFIYTVLANMVGSALLFYVGRSGKDAYAQKFMRKEKQLRKVDTFLQKEHGMYSLIFIRFSPLFPNDVLSLLLGFTEITFTRFIVTTTLGYSVPFLLLAYVGSLLSDMGGDVSQVSVMPLFILLTIISVVGLIPVAVKLAKTKGSKR